ncbi:MAG: protein-glutamate O-methyltransferase CheR [Archaeoglobaceae archaeon]
MTLLSYVKSDLGLSAYKDSYLMRRLRARMVRKGIESEKEYLKVLREDTLELKALKDSLSINVTSFFRNPEVWESLKGLLRNKGEIKVWSAACADGREPYSLAIISDQIGVDMEITATDINKDALQKGREGTFFNIEEDLSYLKDAHTHRYFISSDGKYVVKPFLKKKVNFVHHDIINDPPPASDFDLVLCRNFLIYIEPENKPIVSEHLAESMKRGGLLVLGKTETLPIEKKFDVVDRINKIFRRI